MSSHLVFDPRPKFSLPLQTSLHGCLLQGITCQLHYLDDFLLVGIPNTNQAAHFLALALETLRILCVQVASHKTEGPSTSLTFLEIHMDTHTFELRLPAEKLARLQALI